MARARFIRPEFFTDEKMGETSFGARLLFPGLWCHSDLRGVFEHSAKQIRVLVFPHDEGVTSATVTEWLEELERLGLIGRFEADGKVWGCVVNWSRHQTINGRERELGSRRPLPPMVRPRDDPGTPRAASPSPSPTPSPTLTMAPRTRDDPGTTPPPSSWTLGDLIASHPRIYIGKDEADRWQAVMDEFGQAPLEDGCREIAGNLKTGQRILLSVLTGWLANNYARKEANG